MNKTQSEELQEHLKTRIYFLDNYGCGPVYNLNKDSFTLYIPHRIQLVTLNVVYCPFFYKNMKINTVNVY